METSQKKKRVFPLLRRTPPKTYRAAKEMYRLRVWLRREIINYILIFLGIVSAGFGLEGFLLPNRFIDGGVTGISLLITSISSFPLPVLILLLNIPFFYLGLRQVGKNLAIKSFVAILGLAICISVVNYPVMTSDKLLVAVFGGFFLGSGIGLAVRGGGVLDGTEILALYLSKLTSLTIGDVILILNVVIFSVAGWLLSIETALYSILTYLAASKTVDYFIEGIEEYIGVTIVSAKSEEIRIMLTEEMGRGVTVYKGKRGYGRHGHNLNEVDIIFTVLTRLEISRLNTEIAKIDKDAFVVMGSIKDTRGGMIKKRGIGN